jgi:hypothetical protein
MTIHTAAPATPIAIRPPTTPPTTAPTGTPLSAGAAARDTENPVPSKAPSIVITEAAYVTDDTVRSDPQLLACSLNVTAVPDSVYDPETVHPDDDDDAAMFHEKALPEITTSAVLPSAEPLYVPDGIVDGDDGGDGGAEHWLPVDGAEKESPPYVPMMVIVPAE